MTAIGAFTFVLHCHLPYVRFAGRWPHGEEWIHEAISETYIPLLKTLYDLKEQGIDYRLTISITPVLAEQLADPDILKNFDEYVMAKMDAAKQDIEYFREKPNFKILAKEPGLLGDNAKDELGENTSHPHLHYLARWYRDWYKNIHDLFHNQFNKDVIGAFKQLQDDGYIEIITSAATHGYLPLLSRDSSIYGQIKTAMVTHERLFGRKPTGIWLPECAYRPAYYAEDGALRPGLESFLAEQGIKVFFSETHTITGGQPVGVASGDVIGPYGTITRRYVIPHTRTMPIRQATTYKAYLVSDSIAGNGNGKSSGVAVIGRNNNTGEQVWSASWGYPGDFDYREFHKKAGTSGLQYWRVTGDKVDLINKDYYHPDWAAYKVEQHAEHFAHMVGDFLRNYHNQTGDFGLVSSNYDAELFGHWWFEGVSWLEKVLRHLAQFEDVRLTTAGDFIDEFPPEDILHIPESSWGAGGNHFVWDNGETHWMWKPIHECEQRMEDLANTYIDPSDDEQLVLNQAARELLLLQSSDWAFLITTGQARGYAIERFSRHCDRFEQLVAMLTNQQIDTTVVEEFWFADRVFPNIDYRWFATYKEG